MTPFQTEMSPIYVPMVQYERQCQLMRFNTNKVRDEVMRFIDELN